MVKLGYGIFEIGKKASQLNDSTFIQEDKLEWKEEQEELERLRLEEEERLRQEELNKPDSQFNDSKFFRSSQLSEEKYIKSEELEENFSSVGFSALQSGLPPANRRPTTKMPLRQSFKNSVRGSIKGSGPN